MTYTTGGLVEIRMAAVTGTTNLDLTSTGDKARWAPGQQPVIIRGVAVALNAAPGDAGVVKIDVRPTYGSDTSRGDGDGGVVNLLTSHTAGKVVYKLGLNKAVNPGMEVVAEVTDASASVNSAQITLLVEPAYEQPANITAMVATT